MDINPEHGRDFMYDFYAILGVEPTASRNEVAAAFRDKQLKYHPDRYVGLADKLAAQARRMSEVLSLAYQALGSAKSRKEYDALLSGWDGPISRDGIPILDLRRASVANLLQFDDASWLELSSKIELLTGDDLETFELIEGQYLATEVPSDKLATAYAKALQRKLARISVAEGELLSVLGVDLVKHVSPSSHFQGVELAISARQHEVKELASGIAALMLSAGELSNYTNEQVEQTATSAIVRYEEVGKQTMALSVERQEVANQLLQLPHIRQYQPAQETFGPNVFIGLDFGNQVYWSLFRIRDGNADQDETTLTQEEMQELLKPEIADEVINQGYNILIVRHLDDIEPSEQITSAIQYHFDRMTT